MKLKLNPNTGLGTMILLVIIFGAISIILSIISCGIIVFVGQSLMNYFHITPWFA